MNPRTIILVAGWAHTAHDLATLTTALSCPHTTVHTTSPDELLAGASSLPTPSTSANLASPYAHALHALITSSNQPVCLIGWSMGALIALETMSHWTLPVERLVLLSGTPRFCASDDYPTGVPLANLCALRAGLRRNASATLAAFHRDVALPYMATTEQIERKTARALACGAARLDEGLLYLQTTDLRAMLANIFVPTLLLHGCQDRIISWGASTFLKQHLARSTCITFAAAGHDLLAAVPEAVCARIQQFMEA